MMNSLLSVLLLTGALAQAARKKRAVIEGTVAGLPDGVVQLQSQAGLTAKTKLVDGKFRFEINAAFPNDYFLLFENGNRIPVVVEKELVCVDADFSDYPPYVGVSQFENKEMLPAGVETVDL